MVSAISSVRTAATVVTASRSAQRHIARDDQPGGINGVVTFTNLSHSVATNITIQFAAAAWPAQSPQM